MNKPTFNEFIALEMAHGILPDRDRAFAIELLTDGRFPRCVNLNAKGFYKVLDYLHCTWRESHFYESLLRCWDRYYEEVKGKPWGCPF